MKVKEFLLICFALLYFSETASALLPPSFNLSAGSYTGVQLVTITGPAGATICWNLGSVPTTNGAGVCSTGITYIAPAAVASSIILYAIATKSGQTDSSVTSAAYTLTFTGKQQIVPNASSGATYLVNSNTNIPVFVVGDDAFDLSIMLPWASVVAYLTDRQRRGFNAIWLAGADRGFQSTPPKNFYGYSPFDGADFTNEDPNYWAFEDSVIALAGRLGITVFLNPMFVSTQGSLGYEASLIASSSSVINNFGNFIGSRYVNYNNIVYLLGGDSFPSNSAAYAKLVTFGAGIAASDSLHTITLEACEQCVVNGYNSVSAFQAVPLSVPSWLGINWAYPQTTTTVAACQNAYTSSPFLPPLGGENFYEGSNSLTALTVRWMMYTEIFSGCYTGRLFGNAVVWCFNSTAAGSSCTSPTWQSQLGSNGSVSQGFQGQLMRSREHWKMQPDIGNAVLTGGIGAGTTISTSACTSDGQTCMVYDPLGNTQAPQIAMNHFSGTVHAWWFNPQTGIATEGGTFTNTGTHTFTPADGNDWVLVLDLASANLSAPGGNPIWGDVMSLSRGIDWTVGGLPPVLPDGELTDNPWTPPVRTQCGSTVTCANTSADAGTINAALHACTQGHYVLIGSGTCDITSNITMGNWASLGNTGPPNGITLRGSGPMSTRLNLTGANIDIQFGVCCVAEQTGALNATSYPAGTTSVTITGVGSATDLVANNVAWFSQCDQGWSGTPCAGSYSDPWPAGSTPLWVCGRDYTICTQDNNPNGSHNSQEQHVLITNVVNNGGGSYTVTFTPGLYLPSWTSNQTALMIWHQIADTSAGMGLEDMTVYFNTYNTSEHIDFGNTYGSWVKGVRVIGYPTSAAIQIATAARNLLFNNYIFAGNPDNLGAGIAEPFVLGAGQGGIGASNTLVLNNLITSGFCAWGEGDRVGDVLAYQFCRDGQTLDYSNLSLDHGVFDAFTLHEGNQLGKLASDNTHGTHALFTWFRNYLNGWDPPYNTLNPDGTTMGNFQRMGNAIGNAIGGTKSTVYQNAVTNQGAIFSIATTDSLTASSLMRWGNCDTINGNCRFVSGEVPTSLTGNASGFQNTVPGNHVLPCSFFLAGYTSPTCTPHANGGTGLNWWKVCTSWSVFPTSCTGSVTQPFPTVGPDVSGGAYVNGTAYDNPAAVAWKNLPIDTAFQSSFSITGSSWSSGTETLTVSLAAINDGNILHIQGGFRLSGVNASCNPASGVSFTGRSDNEILMTGSSATTISYALPTGSDPGCTGTLLFPDIRQFDEQVYQNDSASGLPQAPTGLVVVIK